MNLLPTDSDPVRWLVRLVVLFVLWRMYGALSSTPHFPAYALSAFAAGTAGYVLGGMLGGAVFVGCVIALWFNSNRWPTHGHHDQPRRAARGPEPRQLRSGD